MELKNLMPELPSLSSGAGLIKDLVLMVHPSPDVVKFHLEFPREGGVWLTGGCKNNL